MPAVLNSYIFLKKEMENALYYIIAIPAIIIASTFHEYSHALAADRLGDPTPRMLGRLTLNPLKHIDPIGALSLILFQFGWSRPVLINPYNFRSPVVGNAIVAAAGPLSNLILIFVTAIPLRIMGTFFPYDTYSLLVSLALPFLIINASLFVFNLIPIPPLDGSRIIKLFIPKSMHKFWEDLDRYSFLLLLLFLIPASPLSSVFNWVLENGIYVVLKLSLGI